MGDDTAGADKSEDSDRMSDFEALMWRLDRSPMLANRFANLTILDRPPDRGVLADRILGAVEKVPRLRQYPRPPRSGIGNPRWVHDESFDLSHHLRWIGLDGTADDAELDSLVARLSGSPFDRGRPLWEFVVIEGLRGGRAAMVQRMHHTIADGKAGIRLSTAFLDLERHPGDQPRTGARPVGSPPSSQRWGEDIPRSFARTVVRRSRQVAGGVAAAADLLQRPDDAGALVRSAARQARMDPRHSPLWTDRSLHRWFGRTQLDLAQVKEAAHRLGGTVNDFFVTGAAAGAGAHHRRHGQPVDELRLSMPISIRPEPDERGDPNAGGNSFTPSTVLVPTATMSAERRFSLVHEALVDTREDSGLGVVKGASAVAGLIPSAALVAAGERATAGVDFVCSNVRAAPFDLYLGGALMLSNHPLGPLAGTAFNLTTMSYRGKLFLGLVVDTAAVHDPAGLLVDIDDAYEELFTASRRAGAA